MRKLILSRRMALLALAAVLWAPGTGLAQQGPKNESDEEFMSRMERELNTLASRAENLDQIAREGTFDEQRNMRLKTRSLKKRIEKEHERMVEQYRTRDEEGFDRDRWGSVVRRFEMEITRMERDLRRF
jgi:BMFP domain-containing protein YqiC